MTWGFDWQGTHLTRIINVLGGMLGQGATAACRSYLVAGVIIKTPAE
jgi:hypothetical protein